ncbi:MAG TPA: hypothetical protein VGP84_19985 [Gemmatimonadaceae bacterium]|nr:hypothetical protein [Gemmatimonadaceae bacterium]
MGVRPLIDERTNRQLLDRCRGDVRYFFVAPDPFGLRGGIMEVRTNTQGRGVFGGRHRTA